MNDIFMYMCFSKTPALSATGDVRPFSDQADGTMLGEGLGMFLLKRLEDAERDGDTIYATITGVGSSSDGRAKSVYAPLPRGQAKAIRRAYERSGFGVDTVELVEATARAPRPATPRSSRASRPCLTSLAAKTASGVQSARSSRRSGTPRQPQVPRACSRR